MSIKITFVDGQVTEYPDAVGVSDAPDGANKFVNGPGGIVIAVLPSAAVKTIETV